MPASNGSPKSWKRRTWAVRQRLSLHLSGRSSGEYAYRRSGPANLDVALAAEEPRILDPIVGPEIGAEVTSFCKASRPKISASAGLERT